MATMGLEVLMRLIKTRAFKAIAVALAAALLLAGGILWHGWNRAAATRGLRASPDGINVIPIPGKPGAYSVNPRFARLTKVDVSAFGLPDPDGPPPIVREVPSRSWRYERASSVLTLSERFDDKKWMVSVSGAFEFPLSFGVGDGLEPKSVRLIVDGKIGLAGEDFSIDGDGSRITLLGTGPSTAWFAFSYRNSSGDFSVGSLTAERLTRAMRSHMGIALEGNCRPMGADGRRFAASGARTDAPWLLELLPCQEGYVGGQLWPRDFEWDPAKGELNLKLPIDPSRFAVYAYWWES